MATPHRSLTTAISATLALLAVSACGSGGSSPTSQAKDVVNNFGHTGSCKLLAVSARNQLAGNGSLSGCQHVLDQGSKPNYTIQSASLTDPTDAVVKVKGSAGLYTVELNKVNGTWLIFAIHQPGSKAPASVGGSSSSQGAMVRTQLLAANHTFNQAFNAINPRLIVDEKAGNLPGGKGDIAKLRTAEFNFDASVRQITFPAELGTDLNSLLSADGAAIVHLDAIGDVNATGGQQTAATFNLLLSQYNRYQATSAATDHKLLGELPK